MNNKIKRKLASLRRIKQHLADHAFAPAHPGVDAEGTAINTAITTLEDCAENQIAGSGTISGAVGSRLFVVSQLLDLMRSLAKAAKVLDPDTYPDVATKMRLTGAQSFEALHTRANLFLSTLTPIAAEFIALGAATTVVADLQALIDELEEAGDLKLTGLDTQIGGTRGLSIVMRDAEKHARRLDAIMCQLYRTNPTLLAQWKAARRVERDPVRAKTPPDGSGGDSGTGGTVVTSGS